MKLLTPAATLPRRMTPGSAGLDLFAAEDVTVPPSQAKSDGHVDVGRALVPTGIAIALPKGTVGRIGSRSGISVNNNVEVGAGWVDCDYRGEILVELKNLSSLPFNVVRGDRVAQLFVLPYVSVRLRPLDRIGKTQRGAGGFGSSEAT